MSTQVTPLPAIVHNPLSTQVTPFPTIVDNPPMTTDVHLHPEGLILSHMIILFLIIFFFRTRPTGLHDGHTGFHPRHSY